MASPTSYKRYSEKLASSGKKISPGLSRFNARYRLATSIQPIQVAGMALGTTDAYFAALRVTLAYTALEALETAIGAGNQIAVLDSDITLFLRSGREVRLREALRTLAIASKDSKLSQDVLRFYDSESDDLRPLVYTIRNLMSHGTFTANRMGLAESIKRRQTLHSMADATLEAADKRFTMFVTRMKG